jgi:phosphoenolpyruvate carboxykinase (GTP)
MPQAGPEAEELNAAIAKHSPAVLEMLSARGKAIYFPKKGILGQTADAKGKGINATIGIAVEDDGSPMRLNSIEKNIAVEPDRAFTYAPSFGRADLREAWKTQLAEKNPVLGLKNISLPVVTSALTHGLSMAGYLFLNEGEKIIIPDPFWGNYRLTFANAYGAEIATFPMFKDGSFNVSGLKEKLAEGGTGKKVLLLNFPNNPSGYTPTKEEMKEIVRVLHESAESGNRLVVIVDDAYFGLVYEDNVEKHSIFSWLCDLHGNLLAVKLDGATKEDYVWGFRVGFMTFGVKGGTPELYAALEAKAAGAIRGNISNASNLSQSLVLKAYKSATYAQEKQEKHSLLKSRYDEVRKVLKKNPKYAEFFEPLPFNSGYFMCLQLKSIDSEAVRQRLLKDYDTGVISLKGGLIRIAFSSVRKEDIAKLFGNVCSACEDESEGALKPSFVPAESLMDRRSIELLKSVGNRKAEDILQTYASLCKPDKIVVLDDSAASMKFAREGAVKNGEEKPLKTAGHTIHYDSPLDQGRDLQNTRVLLPKGRTMSKAIETVDRDEGLKEVLGLMDGIMKGKTMYVKFYCLGPANSKFSIPALQLTDSLYVIHSEDILYRQGLDEFRRLNGGSNFFHFVHSAGRLADGVCADIDRRRVYMDLEEERVFTVNNQYAGNSVGLKKLALRLGISRANREGWLCEHMFIMGVSPDGKGRTTYFTGAFPSACGKTSTAMIPGMTIAGDDIAYLRADEEGNVRAANVEQGIFGIIEDVNSTDDPLIFKALTTQRELIFSNVLVSEGVPYWLGMQPRTESSRACRGEATDMGKEFPEYGISYFGSWKKGLKDSAGKEVLPAHKNARYTVRMSELDNVDANADNPEGVPVSGFIYGGRDSDTSVPVCQSLGWQHGVFVGSCIESETTAAAIGKAGVVKHNPMSNIEFLVIPLGAYIDSHIKFGERLDSPPLIFATNYFLKTADGGYHNEKVNKKVWVLWMEGRVHGEYGAIETPVGFIPKYEDVAKLFHDVFKKTYTKEHYEAQFSIRAKKYLDKLDRMEAVFRQESGIPDVFWEHLNQQRQRLKDLVAKHGRETVSPFEIGEK